LPELWEALGERPRSSGAGDSGRDEPDTTPTDPDRATLPAVLQARHVIRWTLVSWCQLLAEPATDPLAAPGDPDSPLWGRGVTLPDERTIATNTRRDILRLQLGADVALKAYRAGLGTLDEHYGLRGDADRLRAWRASGRDVLEALAEHVDRHLAWLLASDHAPVLVAEIRTAARAWTLVWPARHAVSIDCPAPDCRAAGVRVPLRPRTLDDPDPWITCPRCGDRRTADSWRRLVAPDDELRPRKLADLTDWLEQRQGIDGITYEQLRWWARPRPIRSEHLDDCTAYDCTGCKKSPPLIHPVKLDPAEPDETAFAPGRTRYYDPVAVTMVARQNAAQRRRSP
jgi:hypothetical protein